MARYRLAVRPGYRAKFHVAFSTRNENGLLIRLFETDQVLASFGNWRKIGNNWIQDNSGGNWVSPDNVSELTVLYVVHGVSKKTPPADEEPWNESDVQVLYTNGDQTNILLGFEDNGWIFPLPPNPQEQNDFNDVTVNILLERIE
jgi:hypothetical protein